MSSVRDERRLRRRLGRAVAAGAGAGSSALVLDWGLSLRHGPPPELRLADAAAYAGIGALLGALLCGAALLVWRREADWRSSLSVVLLVLYALPLLERVLRFLAPRTGTVLAVVLALLVLAALLGWAALLALVLPAGRRWLAPLLTALATAAGLALGRGTPDSPLGRRLLVLDLALLLVTLGAAAACRSSIGRRLLALAALVALAVVALRLLPRAAPLPPVTAEAAGRPDLVMVVVDTLRRDVFERAAAESEEGRLFRDELGGAVWFDHALAAAPWTVPSVGSIMTGLWPSEHGLGSWQGDVRRGISRLDAAASTLAETAAAHGYLTLALVTNPVLDPGTGIARGFSRYEILGDNSARLPLLGLLARLGLGERLRYQSAGGVRRRLERHLAGLDAARPLFCWLHLMEPHAPLVEHPDLSPDPAGAALPPAERLYRDEVRYLLRELAETVRLLKRRGRWERTALVITSDHGEMFPSDGHGAAVGPTGEAKPSGHGHALYGELVRVPQIIRPPGGSGGVRRVEVLTTHVDLFPTVAELTGLALPRVSADSFSVAPWLGGQPVGADTPRREAALAYANCWGPQQRALQAGELKLITYPLGERKPELYDLGSDPGELLDLAAQRPELLAAALARLEEAWSGLAVAEGGESWEGPAVEKALRALGYVQ